MSVDGLILAAFLAACAALGLWGARLRKEGLADYALAGRGLTVWAFVVLLVPAFYGGVLGVGEFSCRHGLCEWTVLALPYYVFAVLYAVFLVPRMRRVEGLTIPDHLGQSYGKLAALWGAFLVFILACPADGALMGGTLMSYVLGIPRSWAMALTLLVAFGLLRRGGLRSELWAGTLQFLFMFGGFVLLVAAVISRAAWKPALSGLPRGFLSLGGDLSWRQLAAWWLIALWTFVDPTLHQRVLAAESVRSARRGLLISVLFWAFFDLMTVSAGVLSRALFPAIRDPLWAYPTLAAAYLPSILRGLFYCGLLASILASTQAKALISSLSLGKDLVGSIQGGDERALELLARRSFLIVGVAAWWLASRVPSVVMLWYGLGSAVIPAMGLLLLGAYAPRFRVPERWAVFASASGFVISGGWAAAQYFYAFNPWGLDPLLPGLLAAGGLWGAGLFSRRAVR